MMVRPRDDFRREFTLMNARIDQLLSEEGTTHRQLGEMIGVDKDGINSRFAFRVAWKARDIRQVAAVLDVSVDYLFGFIDVPRRLGVNVRPKQCQTDESFSSSVVSDVIGGDL
ncbi:helix-turn-helix transcriptional regulator [Bifidobacterium sp. SO1]|nr:helix-turn-helix transcriptional regulator [Bifidobacterium sp. SO1]